MEFDVHPTWALVLLQPLESKGWAVDKSKKYFKVRCPCGEHQTWVHLTPSSPNFDDLSAHLDDVMDYLVDLDRVLDAAIEADLGASVIVITVTFAGEGPQRATPDAHCGGG